MPIKLLLEAVAAIVALICLATMGNALVKLMLADRAVKRRREVEDDTRQEIRKPMARAS